MKKINLEEILTDVFEPTGQDCTTPRQDLQLAITLNPSFHKIRIAMKEACRQTLELAAENAEAELVDSTDDSRGLIIIDKDSIINTINQIE